MTLNSPLLARVSLISTTAPRLPGQLDQPTGQPPRAKLIVLEYRLMQGLDHGKGVHAIAMDSQCAGGLCDGLTGHLGRVMACLVRREHSGDSKRQYLGILRCSSCWGLYINETNGSSVPAEPRPKLIGIAKGTQLQGLRTVTGDISILVWTEEVERYHTLSALLIGADILSTRALAARLLWEKGSRLLQVL